MTRAEIIPDLPPPAYRRRPQARADFWHPAGYAQAAATTLAQLLGIDPDQIRIGADQVVSGAEDEAWVRLAVTDPNPTPATRAATAGAELPRVFRTVA
jgi:hypothetical protein